MAQILGLISTALVCTLFQSTIAATFTCTDEPAVCKTKFGNQFERDFKDIHVQAIRTLYNTFIDQMSIFKSELPVDSPIVKKLENGIEIVRKSVKKLDDNVNNDNNIIKEAYQEGYEGYDLDFRNSPENAIFKALLKKHDSTNTIMNVVIKFNGIIANLWDEMYSGLREKDLKAYPEYEQINVLMEPLKSKELQQSSARDYLKPVETMGEKFNLPYLKLVAEFA